MTGMIGGSSAFEDAPSMKVPPKRKGNSPSGAPGTEHRRPLNESPSEKEGKYPIQKSIRDALPASMKVPPKRKGNYTGHRKTYRFISAPQ